MIPFTKELKSKWIDALQSGEFTPGEGYLFNNGKHCCLGVLCTLIPNTKMVEGKWNSETYTTLEDGTTKHPMRLIESGEGKYLSGYSLAGINDHAVRTGATDYSAVIPYILEIPTTD